MMTNPMARTITLNASPTWSGVKDDYVLRYEGHLNTPCSSRLEMGGRTLLGIRGDVLCPCRNFRNVKR